MWVRALSREGDLKRQVTDLERVQRRRGPGNGGATRGQRHDPWVSVNRSSTAKLSRESVGVDGDHGSSSYPPRCPTRWRLGHGEGEALVAPRDTRHGSSEIRAGTRGRDRDRA